MYKTTIDNINMYYQRLGNGEPLVLIHGLGEIKEGWNYQHELADQYDLIIPDLRGHGQSETTAEISIPNFAKDVLALLDYLGIESAHICGLSMGGTVAQEIYRQAPQRCRSLILVSTFHYAPKALRKWAYDFRMVRSNLLTPEEKKEVAARTCLYSWNKDLKDKFFECYNPQPEGYIKSMKACLTVDNRTLLSKISIPTLVIGCQYDTITPVWIQILMHKIIPKSELVIFKNSGHIAKLEATKDFNNSIRSFLNKNRHQKAS